MAFVGQLLEEEGERGARDVEDAGGDLAMELRPSAQQGRLLRRAGDEEAPAIGSDDGRSSAPGDHRLLDVVGQAVQRARAQTLDRGAARSSTLAPRTLGEPEACDAIDGDQVGDASQVP
jgi:hypothetical protein